MLQPEHVDAGLQQHQKAAPPGTAGDRPGARHKKKVRLPWLADSFSSTGDVLRAPIVKTIEGQKTKRKQTAQLSETLACKKETPAMMLASTKQIAPTYNKPPRGFQTPPPHCVTAVLLSACELLGRSVCSTIIHIHVETIPGYPYDGSPGGRGAASPPPAPLAGAPPPALPLELNDARLESTPLPPPAPERALLVDPKVSVFSGENR